MIVYAIVKIDKDGNKSLVLSARLSDDEDQAKVNLEHYLELKKQIVLDKKKVEYKIGRFIFDTII